MEYGTTLTHALARLDSVRKVLNPIFKEVNDVLCLGLTTDTLVKMWHEQVLIVSVNGCRADIDGHDVLP